jgi:hypothetical protein
MTKQELGLAAYEIIVAEIKKRGGDTCKNYPSDMPISKRQLFYIKSGDFNPEMLEKFGIDVDYRIVK